MKFTELEQLMSKREINTLADIARVLKTTPQAVSNWKARDQIPYHIVAKINATINKDSNDSSLSINMGDTITISDLLLTLAEQLKIILITPFILVFLTFTYIVNIQESKYVSSAKVLFPQNASGGGNFSALAAQFGFSAPSTETGIDLSSTSIFPELIQSRRFISGILDFEFYTEKFDKKLTLLSILNKGAEISPSGKENAITHTLGAVQKMIRLEKELQSAFSVVTVTASEGLLAKELVVVILLELESLNRFFKKQTVNQKINFIQNRISSVEDDLIKSEQGLKLFNEKNRQISSPALQLKLDRFEREVETQKGVYLTLKQQLELAKIEEVQAITIVQVLDEPQVPLGPYNKNWKSSVIIAGIFGLGLGVMLGFIRTYINNPNIGERKKIRRVKNFLKKKGKDFIMDRRATGLISVLMVLGLPYYLTHTSLDPVYFGLYSLDFMIINIIYIFALLFFSFMFVYSTKKK